MDAEDPRACDEGVATTLKTCASTLLASGSALNGAAFSSPASGEERRRWVAFGRVRRNFCQRVEQLGNPAPVRAETNRIGSDGLRATPFKRRCAGPPAYDARCSFFPGTGRSRSSSSSTISSARDALRQPNRKRLGHLRRLSTSISRSCHDGAGNIINYASRPKCSSPPVAWYLLRRQSR